MADRNKPPLALDVEVETPNGVFRLASDSPNAATRPSGMSFSTQRGDGFGPASVTFNRQIFKDYPDINLLDTWRFVGKQGDIAWEGKLYSNPRTNNPTQTISPNLVGWMTYLKSRKAPMLVIDSRLGSWGEDSLQRQANLSLASYARVANLNAGFQDKGGLAPGFFFDFQGVQANTVVNEGNETCFYGGGENIGMIMYDFLGDGSTPWSDYAVLATDDVCTGYQLSPNYNGSSANEQYFIANSNGYKYGFLQAFYTGGYVGTMTNRHYFTNVKVTGTHGLTLRGTWPIKGYYISDIIPYMLRTYYPKISWAGEENTFVVQQATWHDSPSDGYEILQTLNNLTLWETSVWEDRKLYYEPADLTTYDWQIRTDDPGVEVVFEGDSIENFANGVSVTYTDFAGVNKVLWPNEHAELRDENANNPANTHEEILWTDCSIPSPCSEPEALQFGRTYLAEYNRAKRPGTFKVSGGYIQDKAGHWHQGWKVRSSDTIAVMNHPDEEPRLIFATNWDVDSKSLDITVDAPPKYLDAIIARQEIARTAAGMA